MGGQPKTTNVASIVYGLSYLYHSTAKGPKQTLKGPARSCNFFWAFRELRFRDSWGITNNSIPYREPHTIITTYGLDNRK
jgi:hypothetical protein